MIRFINATLMLIVCMFLTLSIEAARQKKIIHKTPPEGELISIKHQISDIPEHNSKK